MSRRRPKANSRTVRKRRQKLYNLHNDCCYCGKILQFKEFTIEHIKPLSIGGTHTIDNLDVCCLKCNNNHDIMHKLWNCFDIYDINKGISKKQIERIYRLYYLLENYIYNKQRRIRHPIYDIYPVVKFLRANVNSTKNESHKSYESITTTTIFYLSRLIRKYCDKLKRFCIRKGIYGNFR